VHRGIYLLRAEEKVRRTPSKMEKRPEKEGIMAQNNSMKTLIYYNENKEESK
jgi:hypothetical protein